MAFTRFATIVFLIGLAGIQRATCAINPLTCQMSVTEEVVETTTVQTTTMTFPMYPNGLPNFYNNNGLPMYTMNYPFYSPFKHSMPADLLSDYDVNMQMANYAYQYNMPATSLYQWYDLMRSVSPNLPPQNYLNTIQSMAQAYQAERSGYMSNYRRPKIDELYANRIGDYLPTDYPPAYRNMMAYLDSRVPFLSGSTNSLIQGAIYNNIPQGSEYLNFALSSSMRYMMFSQYSWRMAY